MSFRSASIFPEVGITFPISGKVSQLVLDKLIANLPVENQEVIRKGESYSLGIVVSTGEDVAELSVLGPSISKKYKMIDYAVWIPYRKVIESENVLMSYIDYLYQGIVIVLKKYDYPTAVVAEIFEDVKREVNDNPEYKYNLERDGW